MFFSPRNKEILKNHILKECNSRGIGQLGRNHIIRLDKTLGHYMNEVWTQANSYPIPYLNREVGSITQKDFMIFLTKPATPIQTIKGMAAAPAPAPAPAMSTPIDMLPTQPRAQPQNMIYQDTGRTLEQLQKERQGAQPERPVIPDFRINSESDDGPSPLELYELAKVARDREAANRPAPVENSSPTYTIDDTSPPKSKAADVYRTILGSDISIPTGIKPLPPPIKTKKSIEEPPLQPPPRVMDFLTGPQPSGKQHTLIAEDEVLQYKEIEHNLFVNSVDRNWTKDSVLSMNRYNFTVNFDPSAQSQNSNITPQAIKKFRNIVRIQLIKIIVARETLDVMLTKTDGSTYATTSQTNVLSFPSVTVRVSELDGNNYGTNPRIDDSFGLVHYDAQWVSDPAGSSSVPSSGTTTSNGYVSLIPKFLKCQKVYEPTPLDTLRKLSIRLERPTSASLLSDTSDVVSVKAFQLGSGVTTTIYTTTAPATSEYIFIETDTYFSKFLWEVGDRVIFKGIQATLSGASATTQASVDRIQEYLNREEGHLLVGYAVKASTAWTTLTDGANKVGYANVLIFQSRFNDPAPSGAVTPYSFGTDSTINSALSGATDTVGYGINASHQVQAVFRIITREYDPATKLRPDNIN